jgi:O-antigen ligase
MDSTPTTSQPDPAHAVTGSWSPRLRVWGAFIAIVTTLTALVHDNGGVGMQVTPYVTVLVLLAVPAAAREISRWPRIVRWSYGIYVATMAASLAMASQRSWIISPLLITTSMFILAGAAGYLWHHSTRLVVVALVTVTAVWFLQALSSWLVVLDPSQPRILSALGWHNPSAVFYGALALVSLGASMAARRWWVKLAEALTAGTLLGLALLTQSRGGIACVALGLVLLVTLARPVRRSMVYASIGLLATPLTWIAMWTIAPTPVGAPASAHLASALGDFGDRIGFWRDALRIIAAHPLLGTGPGSWYDVVWRYVGPHDQHSTAAHNWYLQTAAEQGVLSAMALTTLAIALCVMAARARRSRMAQHFAFLAGCASAVVVLVTHAGIDFDNRWPVVIWLLSVLSGITYAGLHPDAPVLPRSLWRGVAMTATVTMLLVGVVFGAQYSALFGHPLGHNVTWNTDLAIAQANSQFAKSDYGRHPQLALDAFNTLAAAQSYNPGDPRLTLVKDTLLFELGLYPESALVHDVRHQHLVAWAGSFQGVANVLNEQSARYPNHPYWRDSLSLTRYAIAYFDATPTWDYTLVYRRDLYLSQLQASFALYGCSASQQVPILNAQHALLTKMAATQLTSTNAALAQIRIGCPNLAAAAAAIPGS